MKEFNRSLQIFAAAAIFLIVLLGVFHSAVAAPILSATPMLASTQLREVDALATKSRDKFTVTCAELKAKAAHLREEILADGKIISQYTQQVSQVYGSWADELVQYEDQKHEWPKDQFKPVEASYKTIDKASEELFAWSDIYGQELEAFSAVLVTCVTDIDKRAKLTTAIAQYEGELNDAQTSAASFVADMKTRLKDWTRVWRNIEGTVAKVPQGYFQSLRKDSDDFNEASQLFTDNAQLLSEHYKAVLSLFDAAL